MGIIIIEQIDKRTRWVKTVSSQISLLVVFQPLSQRQLSPQLKELRCFFRYNRSLRISHQSKDTMVSEIASQELLRNKVSGVFTEVTWQTLSDTSQLKLLTSHAKINSRRSSTHMISRRSHSSSSLDHAPQVVLQVLHPFASYIHSISLVPDLLLMLVLEKLESSLDLLTAWLRTSRRTDQWVSTEDSVSQSLVLLCTELLTSVSSILVKSTSGRTTRRPIFSPSGCSLNSVPSPPVLSHIHLIPL